MRFWSQRDKNTPTRSNAIRLSQSKGVHMLSMCYHRASNCLCCSTFSCLPGFLTLRLAGWLWLHVLNVSGIWGRESSSALSLPHFLQASGIHWVGVRLLDSAVASWLGRRGDTKGCSGIVTRGGSLATQRLLVFAFVCVSVESNWRRQGGVKRTPHFFFFCL